MGVDTAPCAWQNRGMNNDANPTPPIDAAAYKITLPAYYEPWLEKQRAVDHAYALAVARTPFWEIADELEGADLCPECDEIPADSGTQSDHGMIGIFVIIGCEGYHTIESVSSKMP